MRLLSSIKEKRDEWLIKKALGLENGLKNLSEQAFNRKTSYEETKSSYLSSIEHFSRQELSKGGLPKADLFIRDRILDKLATLESNYRQETVKDTGIAQKIKGNLSYIYKFDSIQKSVNGLLNESSIGEAYDTVVEAYKQSKIDKEKFKQIRKDAESKLSRQVHYSDVIVQDMLGRVLLLKRAEGEDEIAGKWCLPGGHVDPGESHKEAAIRELCEETAIDVPIEYATKMAEVNSSKAMIEYYQVNVDHIPVIAINVREHQDYEWVNVYDIPKYDLIYDLQDTLKKIFKHQLDPSIIEIKKSFNTILLAYLNDKLDEQVVSDTSKVYFEKSKQEGDPDKVGVVMRKFKEGNLKSGSGHKVTDRKQALAIALSEAGLSKNTDNEIDKSLSHKYIRKEPDGKGKFNYIYTEKKDQSGNKFEEVKGHAERVIKGEEYIERLSPAEEQGRIRGGSENVIATILCSGVKGANTKDPEEIGEVNQQQKKVLEQYARENGLWVDFYGQKKYWDFAGSGAEARVYHLDDNNVKKVVDPDVLHETPLEYLDRISLHNYLFPEALIDLIGFTRTPEGFAFIVKQPTIKNADNASKQEIKAEMERMGFEDMGGNMFISKDYIVEDLHTGNVLKTKEGNLVFIDPKVTLNLKDEGYGGNREYGKNSDSIEKSEPTMPVDEDIVKSLQVLEIAYQNGQISLDVLEKARTGVYADNAENRRLKRVGQKYGTKGEETSTPKEEGGKDSQPDSSQSIEEQAKQASGSALEHAAKEAKDLEVRTAAHKELDRREREEQAEGSEGRVTIESKISLLKEFYKKDMEEMFKSDNYANEKIYNKIEQHSREISRYLQRINQFNEINLPNEIENAEKLLSLKGEKELESLLGDGKLIAIKKFGDMTTMVLTKDMYCSRTFFEDGGVKMNEFLLDPSIAKGKGHGKQIFYNQVLQFKGIGKKYLSTDAAKSDIYNGYYTWARMGYDISDAHQKKKFLSLVKSSGDKDIAGVKSLPHLMSFPEGREFWKKNGFAFEGKFDLSDNSQSMFILTKYMEEKK